MEIWYEYFAAFILHLSAFYILGEWTGTGTQKRIETRTKKGTDKDTEKDTDRTDSDTDRNREAKNFNEEQ